MDFKMDAKKQKKSKISQKKEGSEGVIKPQSVVGPSQGVIIPKLVPLTPPPSHFNRPQAPEMPRTGTPKSTDRSEQTRVKQELEARNTWTEDGMSEEEEEDR